MTIASAIRNLPERSAPRGRRAAGAGGGGAWSLGALLVGRRQVRRERDAADARRSVVLIGAGARRAGCSARRTARSSPAPGVALVVLWMLPWGVWEDVFGQLSMDFTTWVVAGLMIVARRGVGDRLQRRSDPVRRVDGGASGASRGSRRSCASASPIRSPAASAPAPRSRCSRWSCSRSSRARRRPGRSCHAFSDAKTFGGGFDVRASTAGAAPIDNLPRRARTRRRASSRRTSRSSRASRSCPPRRRRSARAGRSRPTPCSASTRPSSNHTTFGLGALARGYADARAVWTAMAAGRDLAVVDPAVVPAARQLQLRRAARRLQGDRLLLRRRRLRPVPAARCATRRPAAECDADGDRRPGRHRAARDGGHLDVAGDARRRLPRARAADRALPVGRARRRSRMPRPRRSSRRSWRTAWRPSRSSTSSTRRPRRR